jgi:hypothetical protein
MGKGKREESNSEMKWEKGRGKNPIVKRRGKREK